MENPKDVVALLRALVAIPSVNPDGNPGTSQTGERRLARELGDLLRSWGAAVRYQEVLPGRPNLFARWPAPRGARRPLRLALAPHLDTVSVKGMTVPPFDPVRRQGRIYGRGASDTKGSVAAMLWAVRRWLNLPASARHGLEITFAGLMGEEAGNEGALDWRRRGVKADLVLVGEPTGMRVVHAHKGALWFTLETVGQACHSATPERGSNAIYRMGEVLRRLEKKLLPAVARHRHPQLGAATFNVGTIEGGQKVNIVPDHVAIQCDVRSVPGLGGTRLRQLVRKALGDLSPRPRFRLDRVNPSLEVSPEHPLVRLVTDAAQGTATAPWFCDAGILSSARAPAVAIGPGSIHQAHTKDEFIRERDLTEGAEGFLRIFETLAVRSR
ncbi:MAG: M20/M25/M40 family metallo-hydrolase [Verrucomicrobiota bacterium]